MEDKKTDITNGLYLDCLKQDQPQGTRTFTLNGVNETSEGRKKVSIEEANEVAIPLPAGYILLNKLYIGNKNTVIFSVSSDEVYSEIGIMDNYTYSTIVNSPDLGFKISKQIDAVFRLRRGCERIIYFVDPKPRLFNLDKPNQFKNVLGEWDKDKFSLFKTYNKIPQFADIEVLENGNIPPGSYNASIQYLDDDLNPTEFITTSDTIIIYNDSTSKAYETIRGSTNIKNSYQDFGNTNKSIKFTFDNFDTNYPYYRIAIIQANSGTGKVSKVTFSQEISTKINVYSFTGDSGADTMGTLEEVETFDNIVEGAEAIQQIENRLVLVNTIGKQTNFCNLQKYVSKIKADLVTKEVILNDIVEGNPKNPTIHIDGTGYMPGEIYSLGFVYVFDDGSITPSYHIPGRNVDYPSLMSADNQCSNTYYTESDSCGVGTYWGVDSEGHSLVGTPVRHHRFPLRSAIGKPLYVESTLSEVTTTSNSLNLKITIVTPITIARSVSYVIEYKVNGVVSTYSGISDFIIGDVADRVLNIAVASGTISDVVVIEAGITVLESTTTPKGFSYATTIGTSTNTSTNKVFKAEVFGIKLSNIEMPSDKDLNGSKIIGYYIVRQERTDDNKTIVDTAVLTPLIEHDFFVAHGYVMPAVTDTNRIKSDVLGIINPESKFLNKQYKNISHVIQEGTFSVLPTEPKHEYQLLTNDVMPGTSYDPGASKKREKDSDGFDLHTVVRNNVVSYAPVAKEFANSNTIEDIFYLDALSSKVITDMNDAKKEVFNISGDNRIGILQLNEAYDKTKITNTLPYVVLKRTLSDPYANFRVLPYYRESKTMHTLDDTLNSVEIFNGDSYITPMRYTSSVYYDTRLRKRASKSGIWNAIVGVLSVIAGAAIIVLSGGTATAAGLMVIGFGVSQIATGLKKEQISKVYNELYEAGLRNTVKDDTTNHYFAPNPADDTIQWLADVVTNLWFESSVNMSVRQGATVNIPDFLNAPIIDNGSVENELNNYLLHKLTTLDTNNENGRLYQGFPNAEIYEVNLDYLRRDRQKSFYHLGIEYDCCSDCLETFPHRIQYSEQSFQEELTDNYRVFLPNNYRDIEGETGVITDVFRLQNNLYIHTEEALWHLPATQQERVTGDIVSFIGTGDFFGVPPRKIVDSQQLSAGTKHKWATIKTTHGVFFVSEAEGKIYQFNGNTLEPISDHGMASHFAENLKLRAAEEYYRTNKSHYTYNNNVSNPLGIGFISAYDSKKERLIITKRDFSLSDALLANTDYELTVVNGQYYIFNGFKQTLEYYKQLGYEYIGIEGTRLKFRRTVLTPVMEHRTRTIIKYGNEAVSQDFIASCPGGNGTTVTYPVYANTYIADTQAAADALALADIAANGQTHANEVGTCADPCGSPVSFGGGEAYPSETSINLGIGLGTVSFYFDPVSIPDRAMVFINGTLVLDTGYRGESSYQDSLNAALIARGSGPMPIVGGAGTFTFNKTTPYATATVLIYAPLGGTSWSFKMECPT